MNEQTKFIIEKIKNNNIKSILNIGFRNDSDKTIMNYCLDNHKSWTILEAWSPNCETMKKEGLCVINDDVRNIKNLNHKYDAILWLHGPEHISWDEFLTCKNDIELKANKLVIYQAPIGEYPQDELYGNPYEKHVETLFSSMFSELGYQTIDHNKNGEKTFSAFLEK